MAQETRPRLLHLGDMGVELLFGGRRRDRADMHGDVAWVADAQGLGRAGDHLDHLVGDILLHQQQPQRRATLPGGAEGRLHHIVGDLFGGARGVDVHGVEAAGSAISGTIGRPCAARRPVDAAGRLRSSR